MRTATEQWFPDAPEHCLVAVGCAVVVSVNNLHLFVKTDTSNRGLAWWSVKILLSSAGDTTSAPGQGVKIPHASQPRKTHTEANLNKFNKDFKKGPHQ